MPFALRVFPTAQAATEGNPVKQKSKSKSNGNNKSNKQYRRFYPDTRAKAASSANL